MAFEKLAGRLIGKYVTAEGGGLKIDRARIVRGTLMAAAGWLFGMTGAAFGCYPFGMALLAAVDRCVGAVFAGLIASALFNHGYAVPMAVVYTAALLMRTALCRLSGDMTAGTLRHQDTAKPTEAGKARSRAGTARSGTSESAPDSGGKKIHIKLSERAGRLFSAGSGKTMFSESVVLRCAVGCFAAFLFGIYKLISGGFLYYDLFGLLTGFFMVPAFTLGFSALFTGDERFVGYREIGAASMLFAVVYSLRGYHVLGFSPAFAAAVFAALWAGTGSCRSAAKRSALRPAGEAARRGCAAGLIAGIACSVDVSGLMNLDTELLFAPCIAAGAGLAAGMFSRFSNAVSAAAVCIVSLVLGTGSGGFDTLKTVLPDTLGAVAVYLPLAHYGLLPKLPAFAQPDPDAGNDMALINEKRQKDTMMRMNSLSEALGRLSDVIYTLSDRLRRPGIIDLKQICDNSFDKYCSRCSLASLCLERECTSTLDAQSKLTTGLYTKGRVEPDDVPQYLRDRCYNIGKILSEMNTECGELVERLIRSDKTEAFALDYESLSKLLAESISENDKEYEIDAEMTAKLRRALRYMDMSGAGALCWGSRRKQVVMTGIELAGMRYGADDLRRAAENTLHTYLTKPKFSINENTVEVSMSSRRRYSAEYARASNVKESESANGDTATCFETKEDYFYALISDGMGSGREAAVTSKLCGVFCEQLLTGGNGKAITLEMLNGFMRSRREECSATVDLAEIDLMTGHAAFVKSGAAPSYVLRKGSLYKLQSKTVPIGIMPALDAEQIKFELEAGDVIILLSDGVAQSLEDGVWLANLITYEWEDNLDIMAEKIVDNAALNNKRCDDMTALLVRVSNYEEEI